MAYQSNVKAYRQWQQWRKYNIENINNINGENINNGCGENAIVRRNEMAAMAA